MIDGIEEITFISEGFKAIVESDGVRNLVQEIAEGIQDRANANFGDDGFRADVKHLGYGGGRWGAFISSTNRRAAQAEAEDKVLTRAVQS